MAHDEEMMRILPLGELSDFEVAEGFPDIRGWRVDSADNARVGTVHELLVDVDTMRTRYLDVRLTPEVAATPGERDVLVPIGTAQLDKEAKRVVVPLHAERITLLPAYDHHGLTRTHEFEVRRHFSLGEAAAAATGAAVTPARDFYDDERYDDHRFFTGRNSWGERAAADAPLPADDGNVRIPVSPDDTVVLKRGESGKDEIIFRRPVREGRVADDL